MGDQQQQPGAGAGAFRETERVTETETRHVSRSTGTAVLLDHERLEVYQVAREFFLVATRLLKRKMSTEIRDQLDRASMSILFNIGEGAGKTARADKQRFYEIARGSTTEAATQLDAMRMREVISEAEFSAARELLVRIAQMLSRLCGIPRARKP
jgi:four helix bundle protein